MQQISILLLLCATLAAANPSPTPVPAAHAKRAARFDSRDGKGITLPLVKRSSHRPLPYGTRNHSAKESETVDYTTDVDALNRARDALLDRFIDDRGEEVAKRFREKRMSREEAARRKRTVTTVATKNHNFDTVYSARMELGTPPQSFDVLLDTGSSDTWVVAAGCKCTGLNCSGCTSGKDWDPSTSSTWTQRGKILNIQYGSGLVTGRTGKDVVSLGGFTINDQVIGLVDQAARTLPGTVEGLLGLAFGTLAKAGGTPWWLRVTAGDASDSGGTLDGGLMSFWFSRYVDSSDTSTDDHAGGQFTLGGTNSSLYTGDINFISLIQPAKWWLIPLQAVGVEGGSSVEVAQGEDEAIIDTGTTLVGGEDSVLAEIFAQIPGAMKSTELPNNGSRLNGFYVLPCNSTAVLTLTFGGEAYTYSTADLLYQRIDDIMPDYCLSSLFLFSSKDPHSILYTPNGAPYWLVGDSFLKNVYSVFSLGGGGEGEAGLQGMGNNGATAQVGFAKLSNVSGEISLDSNDNGTTATGSSTTSRGPRPAPTDVPVGVIPEAETTVVVLVTVAPPTDTPSSNAALNGAWPSMQSTFLALGTVILSMVLSY
ncbi:hypothetical protein FRC19_011578 [Serendipita sp. 401]|nr:hypothetical protein FRC19_011578 [Serendipita sp. 401]KAG9058227.1 hypothetical protein FS842_000168 [Serendipita sp. 407]